jgi:hypothetical protein
VRAAAETRLRELDVELERLHRLRDALQLAIKAWDKKLSAARSAGEPLGLLDALGAEDLAVPTRPTSRRRFR